MSIRRKLYKVYEYFICKFSWINTIRNKILRIRRSLYKMSKLPDYWARGHHKFYKNKMVILSNGMDRISQEEIRPQTKGTEFRKVRKSRKVRDTFRRGVSSHVFQRMADEKCIAFHWNAMRCDAMRLWGYVLQKGGNTRTKTRRQRDDGDDSRRQRWG